MIWFVELSPRDLIRLMVNLGSHQVFATPLRQYESFMAENQFFYEGKSEASPEQWMGWGSSRLNDIRGAGVDDGCAQLRCSVSNVQLVLTCFHHTESFSFLSLFSAQLQLSHTGCYFLRANERERLGIK